MGQFRTVTEDFAVSPQISVADVHAAAAAGYRAIIVNRPDGEEPGMTPHAEIRAAAENAGLTFTEVPIVGPPTQAAVSAMGAALSQAKGLVLAYCRSGTRSVTLWALAQASQGEPADALVAAAGRAGYDLAGLAPALSALSAQR
jgi:uncharacterized protein (TIGR01244 family)